MYTTTAKCVIEYSIRDAFVVQEQHSDASECN